MVIATRRLAVILCFLLATVLAPPVAAQTPLDLVAEEASQNERTGAIARAEETLADPDTPPDALGALQDELRVVRSAARLLASRVAGPKDEALRALEALGEAPPEGSPPEAEVVAQERENLQTRLAQIDALERRSELVITQSTSLIDRISTIRRDLFLNQVQTRGPPPLSPSVWSAAAESFGAGLQVLGERFATWRERRDNPNQTLWVVASLAVFVFAMLGPGVSVARRIARAAVTGALGAAAPTGVIAASRAVSGLLIGGALAAAILTVNAVFVGEDGRALALAAAQGTALIAAARAFTDALLDTRWTTRNQRNFCAPSHARWLSRLLVTLSFVIATDFVLRAGATDLGATAELAIVQTFILTVLSSGTLLLASRRRAWMVEVENTEQAQATRLRFLLALSAWFSVLAAAVGYAALSQFLVERTAVALVAFAALIAGRFALKDGARFARLISAPKRDTETEDPIVFWINAAIDTVLFMAAIPVALLIGGVEFEAVREWTIRLFTGIEIGSFTLSATNLLIGAALFFGLLVVTRLFQRALTQRILVQTRLDEGARTSLTTVTGYVGLTVAVLIGLGTAGVNFSQLALIAGALSVGIGFGLQAIVNNFVSGLILLFERPIKPGDWIVLPSGEGLVKRISVRSTEIETWDLSTIIVPNSELINGVVQNWTHRQRTARFSITVGVGYDSDAEHVRDTLLACAHQEPRVLRFPEPYVLLMDYADSALVFELRIFVADASASLFIRNDIRFAVLAALRREGITIPFPQRDIHIQPSKSADALVRDPVDEGE